MVENVSNIIVSIYTKVLFEKTGGRLHRGVVATPRIDNYSVEKILMAQVVHQDSNVMGCEGDLEKSVDGSCV